MRKEEKQIALPTTYRPVTDETTVTSPGLLGGSLLQLQLLDANRTIAESGVAFTNYVTETTTRMEQLQGNLTLPRKIKEG